MEENKYFENKEIINMIYNSKEEEIDNIIKQTNKEIRDELKVINTERVMRDSNNPRELKALFNDIEDNYNIKITSYNKRMYEKGFLEGVKLILECLK